MLTFNFLFSYEMLRVGGLRTRGAARAGVRLRAPLQKMVPKWSEWSEKVPKWSQNGLEWSENGSRVILKWFSNGPKMVPKWSQNCSKLSQNGPKMLQNRRPKSSRAAPYALHAQPRARAPREPFRTIFRRLWTILGPFWDHFGTILRPFLGPFQPF